MSEFLSEYISNPQTLFVVPLLAFMESCLLIGLFVSGVLLLGTVSIIYAQGTTALPHLIALAFAGALIGDHVGYFVGYKLAPALWSRRWVRKKLVARKVAYRRFRTLMIKSAPWAICVGRLSPPLRSISPVVAGASGLKPLRFFIYDTVACTIWAGGLTALVLGVSQL